MNNEETMTRKHLKAHTFSASYRKIIDTAKEFAAATDRKLLTADMLLRAYLENTQEITACGIPVAQLALSNRPRGHVRNGDVSGVTFSSEVNRILSLYGGNLGIVLNHLGHFTEVTDVHLGAAIFLNPAGPLKDILNMNGVDSNSTAYAQHLLDFVDAQDAVAQRADVIRREKDVLQALRDTAHELALSCFGQKDAIRSLASETSTFYSQTTHDRKGRPLSFAFVGGPGTGKTLCAEIFRTALSERLGLDVVEPIDMSRFPTDQLAYDFGPGRDHCWKDNGKEGELVSRARHHPGCVIVVENVDKACPEALTHLASVLSSGKLRDEYNGGDVSFASNIIIMTTNRGTDYVNSEKFARLCKSNGGVIPREKLVEGISAQLEDDCGENAGMVAGLIKQCDVPVLFKNHTCSSITGIVEHEIDATVAFLRNTYGCPVDCCKGNLVNFFLDTIQKLDSAHGIAQNVRSVLCTELQQTAIDNPDFNIRSSRKIAIRIADLPRLQDGASPLSASATQEEREKHTTLRLTQAKRLDFSVAVKRRNRSVEINVGHLNYKVMPSIEDAGWFAVRPADTTIRDLIGLDEPWRKLLASIDYLRKDDPLALKPSTGFILHGPPGTGKTALAKAVAAELGRSFICINGAEFNTTIDDNRGIRKVKRVFEVARRNKSVLFIDEIDAIGSRDCVTSTQAAVINTFLTELDGFEERKILVIGATNRLDILDPALLRQGRLDTRIKVDVFRKNEDRAKLVELFLSKNRRTLPDDLKKFIVKTTDSWSPASILGVVRETLSRANGTAPTRAHYIAARNAVTSGDETQHALLSDEEKFHVAAHEAGHALMSVLYGHRIVQVTIRGNDDALGFLEQLRDGNIGWTEKRLREAIDVCLAGRAAEALLSVASEGCESDFAKATEYATRIVRGGFNDSDMIAVTPHKAEDGRDWERILPKVDALLHERMDAVRRTLAQNRRALDLTVRELVRRETLFAEDITAHLARCPGVAR